MDVPGMLLPGWAGEHRRSFSVPADSPSNKIPVKTASQNDMLGLSKSCRIIPEVKPQRKTASVQSVVVFVRVF